VETVEFLRRAWEAVQASGVPPELYDTAFRAALNKEVATASPSGRGENSSRPANPESAIPALRGSDAQSGSPVSTEVTSVSVAFRRLSEETEISIDDLSEVLVFEEDGSVGILPRGLRLGKGATSKARTVASLIAGARFGGFGQRTTSVDVIREACEDRGCYDRTNFKSFHLGKHPALGVRDNLVHIIPSKWVSDFQASIERARGHEGAPK
jgi:hypothetical protein